ncbi:MAG: hypothetical protein JSV96_04225 [Candidatus Aminicenantes bacterium]|nr:MAG: hypothetical protein JSV96_04225 [Candidatus Aminicenantes bacterium]
MKLVVRKKDNTVLLNEANLSIPELKKRIWRIDLIIKKINEGSPFETTSGKEVTLDKGVAEKFVQLKAENDFSEETLKKVFGTTKINFPTTTGELIKLTDLKKTPEFGGEKAGARLEKEYAARGQLEELINGALVESDTDSITLRILDKKGNVLQVVEGVTGVDDQTKIGGVDPKADFVLISKGKPPVYISHKDGSAAKDFGQWGGVTEKAGAKIYNHPEVQKFAEDLKNSDHTYPIDIKGRELRAYRRGPTVGRKIQDVNLKLMAIFGEEYNKDENGSPQNVDIVAQGLFNIEKIEDGVYNLTANHMMGRKSFEGDFDMAYEPMLIVRFMEGRVNHGIINARMSLYPTGGRKISTYI